MIPSATATSMRSQPSEAMIVMHHSFEEPDPEMPNSPEMPTVMERSDSDASEESTGNSPEPSPRRMVPSFTQPEPRVSPRSVSPSSSGRRHSSVNFGNPMKMDSLIEAASDLLPPATRQSQTRSSGTSRESMGVRFNTATTSTQSRSGFSSSKSALYARSKVIPSTPSMRAPVGMGMARGGSNNRQPPIRAVVSRRNLGKGSQATRTTMSHATLRHGSSDSSEEPQAGGNNPQAPQEPAEKLPPAGTLATMEAALRHQQRRQPRRQLSDGTYAPYTLCRTPTGHFCLNGCLCCCCRRCHLESEFERFGPGVSQHFKFMKVFLGLFLLTSLISLPALVVCVGGFWTSSLTDTEATVLQTVLASSTIGNLEPNSSLPVTIYGVEVSRVNVAALFATTDLLNSIAFFVAYIWIRSLLYRARKALVMKTITPDQFTLMIPTVPTDVTEDELKRYFRRHSGASLHSVSGFPLPNAPSSSMLSFI